ncbi:MAG: SBBP repeat-containing protein [Acidimicrobiia bacterium]
MKRRRIFTIGAITTILVASAVTPVSATNHADPNLAWAHNIGGTGFDLGLGIAVDGSGNTYLTGYFRGTGVDFNPGGDPHLLNSNGSNDVFVAKYDTAGILVWAHNIGGTDSDQGSGIAVDGSGNTYVTGYFRGVGVDFNPGGTAHLLTSNGSGDVFVAKYDTTGNLVWAHGIGGTSSDEGYGIAVDGSGNTYVTGSFQDPGVDFNPGGIAHLLSSNGTDDVFVAKYDTTGNLQWAHNIGGTGVDAGSGIAVDGFGNTYLTGYFQGSGVDFNPGGTAHLLSSNGSFDVFVAKYDPTGNLQWAHNIGGTGVDVGYGIAVDGFGNTYLTGYFQGAGVDFNPGGTAHLLSSNGSDDVFVAKYDPTGNLVWAHNIGGTGGDAGNGIAVDGFGNTYLTGYFQGSGVDFNPGGTAHLLNSNGGGGDVFVAKYDTTGNLQWAHGIGGTAFDQGYGIEVDGSGNTYLTGSFQGASVDFNPGGTAHLLDSNGEADVFVVKLEHPPTVGLVDPTQGQWHLRNSTGAVTSFYFGNPGDYPIMGDWNCDGIDTPGMYRQSDGYVYLRNTNTQGIADIRFFFGNPGDIPIVGDFNNNGCDTVSIYRPSNQTFYIINALGANDGGLGAAQFSYVFGNPGDKPFTGDFNGNGQDTVGLHRESTGFVYFRNTHTQGNADAQFFFGDPNDRFITGDWNTDGIDTPGIFRPSNTTFYFRFTNTQGNADAQFQWGQSGWLPVSGNFGLG